MQWAGADVTCPMLTLMQANGDSFDVAYGRFIGTLLVTTWLVVLISFMPEWMVRAIFPPFVPGVTIFLIGAALIGTGFQASYPMPQLCLHELSAVVWLARASAISFKHAFV